MSAITTKKPVWQYLKQADGGRVMITPRVGEAFGLPIDDVIRACRSQERMAEFTQQVGDLLDRVGQWLNQRNAEIHKGYFALDADGAVLVVVRKDKAFNPDFEDALSELDLGIALDDAFSLVRLRVLALPFSSDETVSSFLNTSSGVVATFE